MPESPLFAAGRQDDSANHSRSNEDSDFKGATIRQLPVEGLSGIPRLRVCRSAHLTSVRLPHIPSEKVVSIVPRAEYQNVETEDHSSSLHSQIEKLATDGSKSY
jgi:hypothetical protein